MIIIYTYLAVGLLIASWVGLHAVFRVNRSDWPENRTDAWLPSLICIVLWPAFLFKPRNLVDPSTWLYKENELINLKKSFDNRQRELELLRTNPPPCGSTLRYRQGHGRYEETYGEFLFNAEQVEAKLEELLQENPHLANDEEAAILNWVKHRDDSLPEPTDVPEPWYRFQYVANELARAGHAKMQCSKCNAVIDVDLLVKNDDQGKPGWNFNRLVCPNGHNLLVVESVHLCISR